MRPTSWWGRWMGLLSLCTLGALPPSPSAAAPSWERLEAEAFCLALPFRCRPGAAPPTADPLRPREEPPRPPVPPSPHHAPPPRPTLQPPDQPAASVPPEDPLASDCRYVGFQTEWLASKRDAGLPLGAVVAASQRVFARDLPGHEALVGALGPLVYRDPQRSPAALRQVMEAACLAQPRRRAEPLADE